MAITIFIFILTIPEGLCYQNEFALKGGGNFSVIETKSFLQSKDTHSAGGINSCVGYRFTNLEFNMLSHIFYGKNKNITSITQNTIVSGTGYVRAISFTPSVKYLFDYTFKKVWHPYFMAGPTFSQHTIKMENFQVIGGAYTEKNRISYRSTGFTISIGAEEILKFKEMHPVFFEIGYTYLASRRLSLLNVVNMAEVETVSHEDTNEKIKSHILFMAMGMTIF